MLFDFALDEVGTIRTPRLDNNKLSSVPAKIGELKNLKILHLNNNKLSSVPAETGELKNLTYLHLSNNPLQIPQMSIAEEGPDRIKRYFEAGEHETVAQANEHRHQLCMAMAAGLFAIVAMLAVQGGGLARFEPAVGLCVILIVLAKRPVLLADGPQGNKRRAREEHHRNMVLACGGVILAAAQILVR